MKRILFILCSVFALSSFAGEAKLQINDQEYFEMPGLNVFMFHDAYPEGHQGGVTIIQHENRVAANGDIRLQPSPGQWQPVPKVHERKVDKDKNELSIYCEFPDPERDNKGFNSIDYPDLEIAYTVRVVAEGMAFKIHVDFDDPIPADWVGKIAFHLELFPGDLFNKTYLMDGKSGLFPRQLNGPMLKDPVNDLVNEPLAEGKHFVIAPECDLQRMSIKSKTEMQLVDGRALHNNGWFILRAVIPAGATKDAIVWDVKPHIVADFEYTPVIQISQLGYAPCQPKIALVETDKRHKVSGDVQLKKLDENGEFQTVMAKAPKVLDPFYRYQYLQFDFSEIEEEGLYVICYADQKSHPFRIAADLYDRHVWQPVIDYFLPVQMCHMLVRDRYRIWHGRCHVDDALMAPTDHLHFDGYKQGSSTMTEYNSMDPVPGLDVGGWHDAGDYDLRVESQAGTVKMLALAIEEFGIDYDNTTIDQENHLVEMHQPDGVNDLIQQIEHGLLTIIGGYRAFGRLYRGIICNDVRQYVMLGDGSTMTDNKVYTGENPRENADDRWVFTEENPGRAMRSAAGLAAAYRVLKDHNPEMAKEALEIAEAVYERNSKIKTEGRRSRYFNPDFFKIDILCELILSTDSPKYKKELLELKPIVEQALYFSASSIARVLPELNDKKFEKFFKEKLEEYYKDPRGFFKNPYGIPYRPRVWGAGWDIQRFGVQQYFLHKAFPDIVPNDYLFNALDFVLGKHPGVNNKSYASGVGLNSIEVGYGVNRADWSYIPGGVISGTGLIRPDFFELKKWPFFWQQTEYVVGGGSTNFMFLVLAAQHLTAEK